MSSFTSITRQSCKSMTNLLHFKKGNPYAELVCLISVVVLLIIWVLPNTIALRNVLLVIGGISGFIVIVQSHFFVRRSWQEMMPLYLFSLLFVWALAHAFFFSLNPELSLNELKSVWMRAFLASITAIGVSIALRKNHAMRPYFFISYFLIPCKIIVHYARKIY
jgi:hypothetical protein